MYFPLCAATWEVKYCSEKEVCQAVTCMERNALMGTEAWTSHYQGCFDQASLPLTSSQSEIAAKTAPLNYLHERQCFAVRTHAGAVALMSGAVMHSQPEGLLGYFDQHPACTRPCLETEIKIQFLTIFHPHFPSFSNILLIPNGHYCAGRSSHRMENHFGDD